MGQKQSSMMRMRMMLERSCWLLLLLLLVPSSRFPVRGWHSPRLQQRRSNVASPMRRSEE